MSALDVHLRQIIREELTMLLQNERSSIVKALAEELRGPALSGDEMLTPAEAATFCKVKRDSVYRWIREKRISVRHAGRDIRISRRELVRFLESCNEEHSLTDAEVVARADEILRGCDGSVSSRQ